MNVRSSLVGVLVLVALVAGCASGPQRQLEQGACPAFIVYPGERTQAGRDRYGAEITEAELASYRDRELANCRDHLVAGDAAALEVLLEYWYSQQNMQAVADSYKTYVERGDDAGELAEASGSLYKLYAEGQPGLPADPEASFHYLGLAAKYDPAGYQLQYADALYARGLYADAASLYTAFLAPGPQEDYLTRSQRCEINLKLADQYFRGRGVKENWNIGYYYWLEGLSIAADGEWGSCDKQTYYDHARYAYESERRKAAERRLQAMGEMQASRIRDARAVPEQGLPYIATLTFHRPVLREPQVTTPDRPVDRPTDVAPVAGNYSSWPRWAPLDGELCRAPAAAEPLGWSGVFQLQSGAIWSVKSRAGGATSWGSAVAVSPTRLVTNCHFIQDSPTVTLLKAGSSMAATVVAADREGDRCVLQAQGLLPTYVATARRQGGLMVGEDVAAIGNPKGLDTSLSRGLVAQKRSRNGHAYIQTDAAISSGSSGGGLFDIAGNLVGITTFKVSSGESLNFAIAIEEFCR